MRPQSILKLVLVTVALFAAVSWMVIRPRESNVHAALALPVAAELEIARASAPVASDAAIDSTRSTPDALGIHGRLTDATTLTPLAGWTVRLRSPRAGEALARTPRAGDALARSGRNIESTVRTVTQDGTTLTIAHVKGGQRIVADPGAVVGLAPSIELGHPNAGPTANKYRIRFNEPSKPRGNTGDLAQRGIVMDGKENTLLFEIADPVESGSEPHDLVLRPSARLGAADSDDDVVVTDTDGRFDLACPTSDHAQLVLAEQAPLFPKNGEREVGDPATACSKFIEWKVVLERRELFRGRVVEAMNGAPVAALSVALRGQDGTNDACLTGADGRFVTTKRFSRGEVVAAFHDGPESLAVACESGSVNFLSHDGPAEEATLRAAIGPMFRFEPRLARDSIDHEVSLRFVNLKPAELEAGEQNPLADWIWAALRRENCVSFRCPTPVAREHDGPVYAEMMASSGLLFARVELASITDPEKNPLPMSFTLRAVVRGLITRDQDSLVGVVVNALDVDGRISATTRTQEEGGFFLPVLDPSRVTAIELDGSAPMRTPVFLHAGEFLTLSLEVNEGQWR